MLGAVPFRMGLQALQARSSSKAKARLPARTGFGPLQRLGRAQGPGRVPSGCLPGPASGPRSRVSAFCPKGSWRLQLEVAAFCPKVWGISPDGLLASDLPGPPRSPQLPAGLELRRPPEGVWLRSCLACRLRLRPARRPQAHSV